MEPIFLILYVVIVTLLLTLFAPRLRAANPRYLWASVGVGLVALVGVVVFYLTQ